MADLSPCFVPADEQLKNTEPETDVRVAEPETQAAPTANSEFVSLLEEQRLEHMQQIQLLQQQLQEQQRINEQQQQQLMQKHLVSAQQDIPAEAGFQVQPQSQVIPEPAAVTSQPPVNNVPIPVGEIQAPRFQLQPEVFAQIQALTG